MSKMTKAQLIDRLKLRETEKATLEQSNEVLKSTIASKDEEISYKEGKLNEFTKLIEKIELIVSKDTFWWLKAISVVKEVFEALKEFRKG